MTIVALDDYADFRAAADGDPGQPQPDMTTWWPVDLATIIAGIQSGQVVGPVPSLLHRNDGVTLLYPGQVHALVGEPESGKGWIALHAAAQVLEQNGHVLYLDFEDAPASIVTRLLALQAPAGRIAELFHYVQPVDTLLAGALDALTAAHPYTLAIVDGISEAYALLGFNPNDNAEAANFLKLLPRPIAHAGAAVLLIDHVPKAADNRGRYALGAQHKLAGIAAQYTAEAIKRPSRTEAGLIKLEVKKDRHGHVRPHADGDQIAMVTITPNNNGHEVTVELNAPNITYTDTGEKRRTALMEKASRVIEDEPGLGTTEIRKRVGSEAAWVDSALRVLIIEKYIRRDGEPTPGKKIPHYSIQPYRQNTENPTQSDHV